MKYPEDYTNKIIQGDCLEVMKGIPDKSVDLVLTDPPYGINLNTNFSSMKNDKSFKGKKMGTDYDKIENDILFNFESYWQELKRISNKFIIFGADYFMDNDLLNKGSLSIWDKRLTESADKIFGSCFETIWFYPKRKRDIIRYKWAGLFGMENEKINKRLHPTQKPENLIQKLVRDHSEEGQIILDPFIGSGTTAVACKNLKRNFIGIEISEDYCKIARDRLKQQILL